jgi:hypothetical protein
MSDEGRLKQLQVERTKLAKEADPVDRAKIGIKISEILLEDVGDLAKRGEFDQMEQQIAQYSATIQDTHQTLVDSGRNAGKKPGGFKEFEIALRKQALKIDDIARGLTLQRRNPPEKAKDSPAVSEQIIESLVPMKALRLLPWIAPHRFSAVVHCGTGNAGPIT